MCQDFLQAGVPHPVLAEGTLEEAEGDLGTRVACTKQRRTGSRSGGEDGTTKCELSLEMATGRLRDRGCVTSSPGWTRGTVT